MYSEKGIVWIDILRINDETKGRFDGIQAKKRPTIPKKAGRPMKEIDMAPA